MKNLPTILAAAKCEVQSAFIGSQLRGVE